MHRLIDSSGAAIQRRSTNAGHRKDPGVSQAFDVLIGARGRHAADACKRQRRRPASRPGSRHAGPAQRRPATLRRTKVPDLQRIRRPFYPPITHQRRLGDAQHPLTITMTLHAYQAAAGHYNAPELLVMDRATPRLEARVQRPQRQPHEPHHAPHRHAQPEEAPIDIAAVAGAGQHGAEHLEGPHRLAQKAQRRPARRHHVLGPDLHPHMPRSDAHAYACGDETQDPIDLAPGGGTRPMQCAEQEKHCQRREGDPLEDAQRARLQTQMQLHIDRVSQQSCACKKAQQKLRPETPTKWIHRHCLPWVRLSIISHRHGRDHACSNARPMG
ncbi:hypothetical protein XAP6164_1710016 [Xanthomonas phaseoli pv. phaseoli]|nr:hypothetical protein XAP6164_1710016 [Xanthomonas phaseoli pv. phaseoli]